MKFLQLSLATLMIRFYLMMAIIIIAGFSGLWLLSLVALPVFFSCLMGIEFKKMVSIRRPQAKAQKEQKVAANQVQHQA